MSSGGQVHEDYSLCSMSNKMKSSDVEKLFRMMSSPCSSWGSKKNFFVSFFRQLHRRARIKTQIAVLEKENNPYTASERVTVAHMLSLHPATPPVTYDFPHSLLCTCQRKIHMHSVLFFSAVTIIFGPRSEYKVLYLSGVSCLLYLKNRHLHQAVEHLPTS